MIENGTRRNRKYKEERRKPPYFREAGIKDKQEHWHTSIRETNNNHQGPLVLNDNMQNIWNLLRKFTIPLFWSYAKMFLYIINSI